MVPGEAVMSIERRDGLEEDSLGPTSHPGQGPSSRRRAERSVTPSGGMRPCDVRPALATVFALALAPGGACGGGGAHPAPEVGVPLPVDVSDVALLDVHFSIDTTGSFFDEIDALQEGLDEHIVPE